MPIYEYRCKDCGCNFSELQPIGSAPPPCPKCNSENVNKKISSFASIGSPKSESTSGSSCSSCQGGNCSSCH